MDTHIVPYSNGVNHIVAVPPIWLDVAEWVMDAYYLPKQIVCNAWMKKGLLGLSMARR